MILGILAQGRSWGHISAFNTMLLISSSGLIFYAALEYNVCFYQVTDLVAASENKPC